MKNTRQYGAALTSVAGLIVVFGILVAVQVIIQRISNRAHHTV